MNTVSSFDPRRRCAAVPVAVRRLLTLALCGAGAAAQAQGYTETQVSGNATGWVVTTVQDAPVHTGTPGPVFLGTSIGEVHYAAASGTQQTLRAVAAGNGGAGDGNQIFTSSKFSWASMVQPDATHAIGDPITVTLDLHIDGKLAAGFTPYFFARPPAVLLFPTNYHLETGATARSSFSVSDLDSGRDTPVFKSNYVGAVSSEVVQWGDPHSADYVDTYTVGYQSALTADLQDGSTFNWGGNIDPTTADGWGKRLDVNTGHLQFTFDTLVGNHLLLEGELSAEAAGWRPDLDWTAMADFGSTFDAELSAPGGVQFSNLAPGVYSPAIEGGGSVPEPASPALVLAGLAAALIATSRRRRPSRACAA